MCVMANNDAGIATNPAIIAAIVYAMLFVTHPEILGLPRSGCGDRDTPAIPRTRQLVSNIFTELWPHYQKRAYRMDIESFWLLHSMICPFMKRVHTTKEA